MVGVSAVVLMVEISKMATVVTVELETTAAETAEAARKVRSRPSAAEWKSISSDPQGFVSTFGFPVGYQGNK